MLGEWKEEGGGVCGQSFTGQTFQCVKNEHCPLLESVAPEYIRQKKLLRAGHVTDTVLTLITGVQFPSQKYSYNGR